MRNIDVTPLLRPAIAPAWFTARLEENLVGTTTVLVIAAATILAATASSPASIGGGGKTHGQDVVHYGCIVRVDVRAVEELGFVSLDGLEGDKSQASVLVGHERAELDTDGRQCLSDQLRIPHCGQVDELHDTPHTANGAPSKQFPGAVTCSLARVAVREESL